jgi:hypothetical protein
MLMYCLLLCDCSTPNVPGIHTKEQVRLVTSGCDLYKSQLILPHVQGSVLTCVVAAAQPLTGMRGISIVGSTKGLLRCIVSITIMLCCTAVD